MFLPLIIDINKSRLYQFYNFKRGLKTVMLISLKWYCEIKSTAHTIFGLNPYATTMSFDYPFNNG